MQIILNENNIDINIKDIVILLKSTSYCTVDYEYIDFFLSSKSTLRLPTKYVFTIFFDILGIEDVSTMHK